MEEEFELEPGEQITRSVRQHWIVLLLQLVASIGLAILPLILYFIFTVLIALNPTTGFELQSLAQLSGSWLRFLLALWWLFVWMGTLTWFTTYFLTRWIITTTRIVEIHQYGFFSRRVSSFLLNRVQDVTTDVEGLLPTLFGFGTLNVETAGRAERFVMYDIANPTELRDLIMREVNALHADGKLPDSGI